MGDFLHKYILPTLPPISFTAEPVFYIGGFGVTNSMIFSMLVVLGLTLFFALATRRMQVVPGRAQNLGESLVEFLLGLTEGTAGRRVGRRIFPLIATLFLFIIVANWSSLIPLVGTVGGCYTEETGGAAQVQTVKTALPAVQTETGGGGLPTPNSVGICPAGTAFRPFLRAANADLNMTLAMAILAVIVVQVSGLLAHGVVGRLKEIASPPLLAPIHLIGEITPLISLSFRLFGNVFGGEVLVTVMYVLLGSLFVGFGVFIFLGLELLFGFIQATIFSVLTLVYISNAVGGHGGGDIPEMAHAPEGSVEARGEALGAKIAGRMPERNATPAGETHE